MTWPLVVAIVLTAFGLAWLIYVAVPEMTAEQAGDDEE